jgi:hypothetical protein
MVMPARATWSPLAVQKRGLSAAAVLWLRLRNTRI